jgi:hypothetical protein
MIRSVRPSRALGLVIMLAIAGSTTRARADDPKNACFDSYEQAQRLRKSNKLRASREKLVQCAMATCPDFIRKDCAQWAGEVDAAMGSIVVSTKGTRAAPGESTRVFVDGERVADAIDGAPIAVDPGEHVVRCEVGSRFIEQKVKIEAKQQVPVVLDFGESKSDASPPPAPQPSGESRGPSPITWVLGGVAIAGVASFIAFGLSGKADESCAPNCSRGQVDSLRREYLLADVSLVIALAAAGGALYFAFASRPAAPRADAPRSLRVAVKPLARGAFFGAELGF